MTQVEGISLKDWLTKRINRELPCDRDIREKLVELRNSLK